MPRKSMRPNGSRLSFESLEDRCLLDAASAASGINTASIGLNGDAAGAAIAAVVAASPRGAVVSPPTLRVVSASPSGVTRGPVDHVDFVFSEPIDPATFTVADVFSLVGPAGAIVPSGDPAATDGSNSMFRLSFPSQTAIGDYTLVLGPEIRTPGGGSLDQDGDGVAGEPVEDRFSSAIRLVRTPLLFVPGTIGSLTPDIAVGNAAKSVKKFLLHAGAFDPRELVSERLSHAYDEIVRRFQAKGFGLCTVHAGVDPAADAGCDANADLFFAAYDWRLPVLLSGPLDDEGTVERLWNDNGRFDSGVEYLDWWINLARAKWIERYGSADGFAVDIVAHSMGGLVSRSYIQESDDAGRATQPVSHLIMLGTPNHGAASTYEFAMPNLRVSGQVTGCSNLPFLTNVILGSSAVDGCLREVISVAMKTRDRAMHLRKGTSTAFDVIASLRDLMPTFPFLRPLDGGPRVIPIANPLLASLNASVDDLVGRTQVAVLGTNDFDTAVSADIIRERSVLTLFKSVVTLRFNFASVGDGPVIFDRVPDSDMPRGTVIPTTGCILAVPFSHVQHGDLPSSNDVEQRVYDLLAGPITCAT